MSHIFTAEDPLENKEETHTEGCEGCNEECQGTCKGRCSGCEAPRGKLHAYNWLEDVPGSMADSDIVEVLFKNTRKGYYRNTGGIELHQGDMVAVEAQPGHDIGTVSLTGRLAELQMRRSRIKPDDVKKLFRKARPSDIEKYEESRAREHDTMIRSRKIAESLMLNMKIGDVEYQGDGNKAIFYYIADERVDFRQLIKVLAETFKVRIEMRQIGARQEAGRIGGIGPCGRPLCCSSWMSNFVSVGTAAARVQDISLNPQKLAGQCAKLKCCLNFEVDAYIEATKQLPERNIRLETVEGTWYHFKTDIFNKEITYSSDKNIAANLTTITAERVFEIIEMNNRGEKPEKLNESEEEQPRKTSGFVDIVGQDSLTRFDKAKKRKKKKKKPAEEKKDGGQQPTNDSPKNRQGGKEQHRPSKHKEEQNKQSKKSDRKATED